MQRTSAVRALATLTAFAPWAAGAFETEFFAIDIPPGFVAEAPRESAGSLAYLFISTGEAGEAAPTVLEIDVFSADALAEAGPVRNENDHAIILDGLLGALSRVYSNFSAEVLPESVSLSGMTMLSARWRARAQVRDVKGYAACTASGVRPLCIQLYDVSPYAREATQAGAAALDTLRIKQADGQ